jgi:hypothetical protein
MEESFPAVMPKGSCIICACRAAVLLLLLLLKFLTAAFVCFSLGENQTPVMPSTPLAQT